MTSDSPAASWVMQVLEGRSMFGMKKMIPLVLLNQVRSFAFKLSPAFQNLVPTLPTMQLCHYVTSLEAFYQITL